ncbi:guanylate kinase [Salisaeta longa]|uniref:guanylate kinase n=1 Tax=Salisaeta longa TaxID=503170 RepID=UPI0003B745BF|nr:guanylate kinase [Salisaeta longa]
MSARRIIVLTAPSGAGKTTIARRVMPQLPTVDFSVSATTRAPRPGEAHGTDYYFLSTDDFQEKMEAGQLLEYEEVYPGMFYGTLQSEVDAKGRTGGVLLDIDVKGALNVKQQFGDDALVCFIQPPSMEELERRLRGRGTEDEHDVAERLDRARWEMQQADRFDAVVVNDDLDKAVDETLAYIRQFIES